MARMTITCENCGSLYEFTSQNTMMRVKENFDCDECDTLLYKCNEAKDWSYKLIEKHENHKSKFDTDGFTDQGGR